MNAFVGPAGAVLAEEAMMVLEKNEVRKVTSEVAFRGRGRMADRRDHNMGQLIAWLDKHYPDSMPGSPDPEQAPDDNKKGSRVIVKGGAWKRIDSALGGKRPNKRGKMVGVDAEIDRSYRLLLRLFESVPAELSDAHRLAARFVLLNTNTAGGYEELERISELGRGGDLAARAVAKLCREVIREVLGELDKMGYWLGWGSDQQEAERQAAAADRRKKSRVLATAEPDGQAGAKAIAAYRELMEKTGHDPEDAKKRTAEHFGCSVSKVEKATAGDSGRAAS